MTHPVPATWGIVAGLSTRSNPRADPANYAEYPITGANVSSPRTNRPSGGHLRRDLTKSIVARVIVRSPSTTVTTVSVLVPIVQFDVWATHTNSPILANTPSRADAMVTCRRLTATATTPAYPPDETEGREK